MSISHFKALRILPPSVNNNHCPRPLTTTSTVILHILEVHHVYEKCCCHYQNFSINEKSFIEVNDEIVEVSEGFFKAAHPLLGDPADLLPLHVLHLELHVPTETEMTDGTSDFVHLKKRK